MKAGIEYYSSTLSFDQASIRVATVRLIFVRHCPTWVRAYEGNASSPNEIEERSSARARGLNFAEYFRMSPKIFRGSPTRVYVFRR